jgi:hypothetical protein
VDALQHALPDDDHVKIFFFPDPVSDRPVPDRAQLPARP